MVDIEVAGESAVFEVRGLDKLWAFRSRLEIPLRHLRAVRVDPDAAAGWWHGIRLPGTSVPGVITAGTFYQHGKRVFWDVHDPTRTIIVELQDDRYDELIVEVENPTDAAGRLRDGIAAEQTRQGS